PPQVPKDVWSTGKLCWAPVKPDADNVLKAIKDGCSKASIWADDNLVVFAPPLTCYAETGGRPRVEVRITPAGHLDPSDVWEMLATLTPEFAAEQAAMSEGLRRFNAQVESDVARQLGGAP
ncbi:MAG: RusA family crossover junction endodeoxyribonuclease, partial [Planctomycetota bacterium]